MINVVSPRIQTYTSLPQPRVSLIRSAHTHGSFLSTRYPSSSYHEPRVRLSSMSPAPMRTRECRAESLTNTFSFINSVYPIYYPQCQTTTLQNLLSSPSPSYLRSTVSRKDRMFHNCKQYKFLLRSTCQLKSIHLFDNRCTGTRAFTMSNQSNQRASNPAPPIGLNRLHISISNIHLTHYSLIVKTTLLFLRTWSRQLI